jgi:fatty acid desaturase
MPSTSSPHKEQLVEGHRLHWTSTLIWLSFASIFFLTEGFVFWSFQQGLLWLTVPLILLTAHLMHTHLLAFHEAAHGVLCPARWLNDAMGMFIGMLGLLPLALYRAVHHLHHAHLGTERDEELWPFVNPQAPRWLRCLAAGSELLLGLVYTPALFLRCFLRPGSPIQGSKQRLRIWLDLGLLGAFWAAVCMVSYWYNLWAYLAVVYLIPAALAGAMQSLRKYIEHMGLTGSTVLGLTRSVVPRGATGRFLALTLFNEPYHGVHHKYARMPLVALPRFAYFLGQENDEGMLPFPNYRSAFCDMIGSLRDPKVGNQWLEADDALPQASFRGSIHGAAMEKVFYTE